MNISRGFTLIEMAIVLIIITILVGGLAMPLAAQIQARRIAETKKTLDDAREAIVGFAMARTTPYTCTCNYDGIGNLNTSSSSCILSGPNWCPAIGQPSQSFTANYTRPYLPCPDTNGDGIEERTANSGNSCSAANGWLPWVTLGVASQDGWGNRLRYSVDTLMYSNKLVGMPNPTGSSTNLKRVCTSNTCTLVHADNLPVVILSHGPNGWGARNINGNTLKAPTSADELENTDSNANFVSHLPTQAGSASGEFDDLVVWLSDSSLRSRLCPAGGCP